MSHAANSESSGLFDPAIVRTTIAQKVVVAVGGLALAAWSFVHMAGTLSVFAGAETMNRYAEFLRATPLLWIIRLGLLVAVGTHIVLSLRLAWRARRARSHRYRVYVPQASTLASRSMRLSGPLLGAWIVYHILHMYGPAHGSYVSGDVYHNLVMGLRSPWVNVSYIVATLLFALHLHHGLTSAPRSLGARSRWLRGMRPAARAIVVLMVLGFLAPPVAALAGVWA